MSKSISIIGCGWLGLPCALRLIEKGYRVKGTTTTERKISSLAQQGIEPFLLQLDTEEPPLELFESDILFITFPPGRAATNTMLRYQSRIQKLINAARQKALGKIIFSSTTGVYAGKAENPIVNENSLPAPRRESARAMYSAEKQLLSYSDQVTILRFGGLVGPGRKTANFLANKKNIPNPNNAINLVHQADCVQVAQLIVEQEIFGEMFNVVADEHPARKDYYTTVTAKAGLSAPTFRDEHTFPNKIVSNAKLKKTLNYTFLYPDPFLF